MRERREETERLRAFDAAQLVSAGVTGDSPGQEMKGGAWEVDVSLGLWSFVTRGDEVSRLVRSVFESFSCTMAVASPEHSC